MQATPRALRAASGADSEPRAKRAAGPRERAAPARFSPAPVFCFFVQAFRGRAVPNPDLPSRLRRAPAFPKFAPRSTGRNASTRLNRSLWPSFCRTPAPGARLRIRCLRVFGCAFGAASEAARERRESERPRRGFPPAPRFPAISFQRRGSERSQAAIFLSRLRPARGLTPPSRPESPQVSTKSALVGGRGQPELSPWRIRQGDGADWDLHDFGPET